MVSVKQIRSIKQILSTKDYIVLDTETTGLRAENDRIIEIGMVRVVNDKIVNQNGTFINPERPISASASKVNGITAADVQRAPTYAQIAPSIASLLIGTTVVAHNADFDMRFICRMLSDAGFDGEIQVIDTLRLARELIPDLPNHKQGTLCEYFAIDPGRAHRAVDDALACYQILMRCKELSVECAPARSQKAPAQSQKMPTRSQKAPAQSQKAPAEPHNFLWIIKNLPIWVWLIIALLLIGSCNNHRKDSPETVFTPTPISDSAPASPALEAVVESTYNSDYLVFFLSSDEPGEYGEWITLNAGTIDEYSYLAFHIPAGRYSVSNPSSKVAVQLSICQDGTAISSSGYEELIPADGVRPLVLMQGESGEITVSPGQYIKLTDDSPGIWFERLEKLE